MRRKKIGANVGFAAFSMVVINECDILGVKFPEQLGGNDETL